MTYTKLDRNGTILIDNDVLWTGSFPTFVADRSQNIHVVFCDPVGPGTSVEYMKLDQAGNILIWPRVLSIYESNSSPHMAIDSLQYLHVVWDAVSAGAYPIMYTKLDTAGDFVSPPMEVVYPPYTQGGGAPRIAVDCSNKLHLVWVDQRQNPGVTLDVYYKRGENEQAIAENTQDMVFHQQITISPNPFKDRTEIILSIAHDAQCAGLEIYDATGRCVKSFSLSTAYSLLPTSFVWYGTNNNGTRLPAGVYFIRPTGHDASQAIPVILLR